MKNQLLLCMMFVLHVSLAVAADANGWMSRPEIRQIRSLYSEIETAVTNGSLAQSGTRSCDGSGEGGVSVEAVFYENAAGVIRKYVLSGGTGDSAADASYYYDEIGRLRFVFQSLRAVNGTEMETRTYFDEMGEVIYRDRRLKKGPGWAGGLPEDIFSPKEHLMSLCE